MTGGLRIMRYVPAPHSPEGDLPEKLESGLSARRGIFLSGSLEDAGRPTCCRRHQCPSGCDRR